MNKKRAIAIFRREEVRFEKHWFPGGSGVLWGFVEDVVQFRLAEDYRYVRFHCTFSNPEFLGNVSVTDPAT